ncbi:MAG: glycosyltransferase [Actinomycetota bacterium]|nr:glycosyltransferase [Actinomycetota bacterium]
MSVVVPSFNNARFIEATIDSVLTQTFDDLELIVIDDGSSDDSVERIRGRLEQAPEGPVCRLVSRENRGIARTLNEGLALSRGRYFAYLDSDDTWEPTRLERQLIALGHAGPGAVACFSDGWIIDAAGERIGRFGRHFAYHGGDIYRDLFLVRFMPSSPTSLFVRDRLEAAGSFDERRAKVDYDVWLRVARLGPVVYVPEPLGSWRHHGGNFSIGDPARMLQSCLASVSAAVESDRALAPLSRQAEGRHRGRAAVSYYDALDLRRARAEAVLALRLHLWQRAAWRTLAFSFLGPSLIGRLRGWAARRRR